MSFHYFNYIFHCVYANCEVYLGIDGSYIYYLSYYLKSYLKFNYFIAVYYEWVAAYCRC